MGASESREKMISALALTAAKRLVEHCEKGIVKIEANGHSPDTVKYEFTHAGMCYIEYANNFGFFFRRSTHNRYEIVNLQK
jgi:hypothetical protein